MFLKFHYDDAKIIQKPKDLKLFQHTSIAYNFEFEIPY